ncbi:MAG TPA: enolase C-terminal domain-like protein [Rectinemataceae bacterium]|nr:enolase C-terminal domain-like protein [Rectinemataceae bacterium]
MSIIESFAIYTIRRPASSMLATTYGPAEETFSHVLVCLKARDGAKGWGEATPLPDFTGETASSIRIILEEELLPTLIGMESGDITEAHRRMDAAIHGNTAAKAAADMALYDLTARALGVPEYVLLGGLCRGRVGVNRHIGITPKDEAVRLALAYVSEGYTTLKLKVGRDPEEDVGRVKAVRDALGGSVNLRVDANQGYDLATARRVLRSLESEDLEFFEQPLNRDDARGLRLLRETSGVRIAADESLGCVHDAIVLAENHCVDVFIIKLIKLGGLKPALDVAAIAKATGIRCVVTSVFDTQLGAAHCLHLAAALPESLSCDLTCYASQPGMAESCHSLARGAIAIGIEAGCGVTRLSELSL